MLQVLLTALFPTVPHGSFVIPYVRISQIVVDESSASA